ncbi:unnamed protein product [Rhizophagus irregularis]|nr:unnamed protein product [Rhizophagus irregularis]
MHLLIVAFQTCFSFGQSDYKKKINLLRLQHNRFHMKRKHLKIYNEEREYIKSGSRESKLHGQQILRVWLRRSARILQPSLSEWRLNGG